MLNCNTIRSQRGDDDDDDVNGDGGDNDDCDGNLIVMLNCIAIRSRRIIRQAAAQGSEAETPLAELFAIKSNPINAITINHVQYATMQNQIRSMEEEQILM